MRAVSIRLVTILIALALFLSTAKFAFAGEPGSDCGTPSDIHDGWMIGSPEQQGFDPALLCAMGKGVTDGQLADVDSVVVIRHGVLVYERYFLYPDRQFFDATMKHAGNSMTKSVVSLLVGIAVDRGLIKDLDTSVFSYFPEYADLSTPEKDRITLRNLLTMSDGLDSHGPDPMHVHGSDPEPYRYALGPNLAREPGVSFEYKNSSTELVGAILQKVTGKTVDVLARENIFAPLGIDDVDWSRHLGNGFTTSSDGLSLRARDWAKIGQLVLNQGLWKGKQIVSASWIAQSTAAQLKARGPFSYGFQWWLGRSLSGDRVVEWTAAIGFNDQKTIILPELDMVVVFLASHESIYMARPEIELLNLYILPAILKH
jgi:CubicO group peptidase (beta-lactamase class C family)